MRGVLSRQGGRSVQPDRTGKLPSFRAPLGLETGRCTLADSMAAEAAAVGCQRSLYDRR